MILQGDAHIGKVSSMMDKVYAGSDAANVFLIFTPQIFSFLAQWKISSDAAWWRLPRTFRGTCAMPCQMC